MTDISRVAVVQQPALPTLPAGNVQRDQDGDLATGDTFLFHGLVIQRFDGPVGGPVKLAGSIVVVEVAEVGTDEQKAVFAEGISKAIQDILATLRAALDLVPDRCISHLPLETAHPLRLKINDEISAALNTARDQLQKLLDTPTPTESVH